MKKILIGLTISLSVGILFGCSEAASEKPSNKVLGIINAVYDGKEMVWNTLSYKIGEKEHHSAYLFSTNKARLTSLNITGFKDADTSSKDSLSIDLGYFGDYEIGKKPITTEIHYQPVVGTSMPIWTTERTNKKPTIEIEALDISGDSGNVTATFSGELCLANKLMEDPDLNNCKIIEGSFDTKINVNLGGNGA